MPRLEFLREGTGQLVAQVQAGDPASIPAIEDLVYAPSAENPGIYACFQVSDRQFYYDQQGNLTLVGLTCRILPSGPVRRNVVSSGAAAT